MSKNLTEIPRLVKFLADVKKDINEQYPDAHIGQVGSFTAMHYLDDAIMTLNQQYTHISYLKSELSQLAEENKQYRKKYGEIY